MSFAMTNIRRSGFLSRALKMALLPAALCAGLTASISHATVPPSELGALLDFYISTNGNDWISTKTNDKPWFKTVDVCQWKGIECDTDNINAVQHIIGLGYDSRISQYPFYYNNLTGTIPSSINQLTFLRYFSVHGNELRGSIPDFSRLNQIEEIILNVNHLTGTLPSNLNSLSNLKHFSAYGNNLTGNIPDISGMPKLVELNVRYNQLTGNIPNISGTPNLSSFLVDNNQLTGNIPDMIRLPKLQLFTVSNNQLTGNIPDLSGMPDLGLLDVSNNQLSGRLPDISRLTNLVGFYVGSNALTGFVPMPPPSLEGASLCPNQFVFPAVTPAADAAWTQLTHGSWNPVTPWWADEQGNVSCQSWAF